MSRILLFLVLLTPVFLHSQKGVIPFTGIVYESRGITAEEIDATLNGETWTSNRLPVNVEMKIRAIKPRGFVVEDGMIFPGVQVLIMTMSDDTLANLENILGDQSFEGFDSTLLNKLSVTLTFDPENSKPGDSLRIVSRFYDTKSSADLYTKLHLVITQPDQTLETSTSTSSVGIRGKYLVISSGLEVENVSSMLHEATGFDTPFQQIRFGSVSGLTPEELKEGSITTFSYSPDLTSAVISLLPSEITVARGSTANSTVLLLRVPLRGNIDLIRVRWESKDRLKVFDLVTELE